MRNIDFPYKVLFGLGCICLVMLAIIYANERILFSDTAGYILKMINEQHFIIPTNRFIGVFSQILPLAGIFIGLPLSVLVLLYSLNFILIPVLLGYLSIRLFKNWQIAISILLLYTLMSGRLFYYPVSEFQMGLCLLLFYHAFFLHYIDRLTTWNKQNVFIHFIHLLLVITIVFSHPLSMFVFLGWVVWLVFLLRGRQKILLYPVFIIIITFLIKETYFKAIAGDVAYDDQKAEGVKNFLTFFPHYFEGQLFRSAISEFTGDYFMAIALFLLFVLFFLSAKKIIPTLLLTGSCLCFFLLTTVSFRDNQYNYYYEHLYQTVPFFLAFAFSYADFNLSKQRYLRYALLVCVFSISIIKIHNGSRFQKMRLAWYQHYLNIMNDMQVQKAALSRNYINVGSLDSYWSASSESLLLSSLPGPDSSKTLFLVWNFSTLQQDLQDPTVFAYDGVNTPIEELNTAYFRLNKVAPYVIMDSVVQHEILNPPVWK